MIYIQSWLILTHHPRPYIDCTGDYVGLDYEHDLSSFISNDPDPFQEIEDVIDEEEEEVDVDYADDDYSFKRIPPSHPSASIPKPNPHEQNSTHLITKYLFASVAILTLFERFEDVSYICNQLLALAIEEAKYLDSLDLTIVTEEEIERAYEYYVYKFMELVGAIGNRGQNLSKKSRGVVMMFAIHKSISYTSGGHGDRMDHRNCCLQWLKRHWFYIILLNGGSVLDNDMAESIFDELFDMWDATSVCCQGTRSNKKGNKWPTMLNQLRVIALSFGDLDGVDPCVIWDLFGLNNLGWRVAYHASRSRGNTPYGGIYTSSRAKDLIHNNPNAAILRNKWVCLFFVCHASAMMSQLPNSIVHPQDKIERYAKHSFEFFRGIKDDVSITSRQGISVPSALEELTYFHVQGKLPGFKEGVTPESYAARTQCLAENMALLKLHCELSHLVAEFIRLGIIVSLDSRQGSINEE